MKCPACGAWTTVKETRTRKTDGVVTRRYECGNLHRFSTEERVRYELLPSDTLRFLKGPHSGNAQNARQNYP